MAKKNKIHKINLPEIKDFVFEIVELSDDSLAMVFDGVPEKAEIESPDAYIDYVIAKSVNNLKEFIKYIKELDPDKVDIGKVRRSLAQESWRINDRLDPDNVIIRTDGTFRLMDATDPILGETILTETNSWIQDNPLKLINAKLVDENKSSTDLEYTEKKKWWKRINQYIKVKVYKEVDAYALIGGKYFHSRTTFNTFIVSVCVVDYEELFLLLDEMGIPKHVPPPVLMLELHELCVACNPFLTYENSKRFFDKDEATKKGKNNASNQGHKAAKSGTSLGKMMDQKTKKRFCNVPKEDLLALETNMKVSLIGQDTAVHSMCNAIQRASVGLKDPNRPIGSFLLAGRSGCGKTLSSKVLADTLIKDRDNLITIDCSEYSADHEYAKLIGAPAGYTGHDQGGVLTNAMMTNPFAVVVFDEIEKASSKLHQLLLQIMEEGRLTDGKGQAVSFRDAIVIMTSNIGVDDIDGIKKTIGFGDVAQVTTEKKNKALSGAIKKKFKPELLNRIDEIIYFNDLTKDDYMRIIDLELYKLNDNLKANDTEYSKLFLRFNTRVRNHVYKHGINVEYGARPLKRFIETEIATPLAKQVLAEFEPDKAVVQVGALKGKITFKFMDKTEADKTRGTKKKVTKPTPKKQKCADC